MTFVAAVADALLPGAAVDETDGTLRAALAEIYARAKKWRPDTPFDKWTGVEREALLREVLDSGSPGAAELERLREQLVIARYGHASSWPEVGFRPLPPDTSWPEAPRESVSTVPLPRAASQYDVVIVGAGAGGGVAARVLTAAGLSVLLVERGPALDVADLPLDHARSARAHTGAARQADIGADATARIVEDEIVLPRSALWNANAALVGGGTRVYGAQAWRMSPEDFRMASEYGEPFVDWPISYDDLERYYDRVEWEIGVCGQAEPQPWDGPRSRAYPMPPISAPATREILERGAAELGWTAGTPPLLINSVARDGRAACVRCATCVGFACHAGAKNGTHNSAVRRAWESGGCDVVERCVAKRVVCEPGRRVRGVELVWGSHERTIHARHVVVACGAIESARLLLASGLATRYGQVGRYLQGHLYTGAIGVFDDEVEDCVGPGPSICVTQFRHHNDGLKGGGILARDFVPTPIEAHRNLAEAGFIPRMGLSSVAAFASVFRRAASVVGPTHEVPQAGSRVTLDERIRDRYGVPLVRLTSSGLHAEDRATGDFLAERAAQWLRASGSRRVAKVSWAFGKGPSADQHQAGTCRMGTHPRSSVCDSWGRVWGHEGVSVADASLHVTNGGVNPVLTIMALAWRVSECLAADLGRS